MSERFGECDAVRQLGKGGMSAVWEAVNARLGSRCAVKVYDYARSDDGDVQARFEQEGHMLAKLCHPRIVGVSDFGRASDGRPYFVMDLVLNPDGVPQTLADVPEGSVDEITIARWYEDIREGLEYVHAKGIVHRDLKLQNVMVGPDGHAVITDFGISRVDNPSGGGATIVDPVQTIVRLRDGRGALMGSVGYMAPELEMGLPATPASDWYALGVIVYKLLTGTWCDARTDLAGTLDTYDPVWMQLIPKLLHANPAGRECPSFAEASRALQEKHAAIAEERFLSEKRRGHLARHVARYAVASSLLLSVVVLWGAFEIRAERRAWRSRVMQGDGRSMLPPFDDLFRIPAAARADDQTDARGNVIMPSRGSLEASRVDALVLTQPLFAALESGSITVEKVISDLEKMADGLTEDAESSPLDNLEFGGTGYMQLGDNGALRFLLLAAVEKLRSATETE